jgi:hypothetical protein
MTAEDLFPITCPPGQVLNLVCARRTRELYEGNVEGINAKFADDVMKAGNILAAELSQCNNVESCYAVAYTKHSKSILQLVQDRAKQLTELYKTYLKALGLCCRDEWSVPDSTPEDPTTDTPAG